MEHPLKAVRGNTQVIGSCNGLLCLCNSQANIVVLWNISTRKHHRLPYLPLLVPKLLSVALGFGYDPVHDDYKVMRIVQFGHLATQVMIYSLKSNSWEMVGSFPYQLPPGRSMGLFADGAIHWPISIPGCDWESPAAFDLATEEYNVAPRPPFSPCRNFIRAWDGRLCGICYYDGERVEIWVLNRDKSSWDKLGPISDPQVTTSSRCIVPMAYLSNGNEVLLLWDCNNFLHYHLKTNKVKNVTVHGWLDYFDAALCVESLVNPSPMANRANGDDATMRKHKSERSKKNGPKRDVFLSKGFKLVL